MIKAMKLENFQAHKDTTINFQPGVNVIVGPSDRGKSSVIRALQLAFFNRPSGKAYIRHGAKECNVTVEMATGEKIKRVRSTSKNYYQIDDNEPLKAPGTGVPPEVEALCPMQEINFQGQHDKPFMLAETAGEVGRMLNRCVDLTVIDKTLNNLNTKKRDASNQLEFVEGVLREKIETQQRYAQVDDMEKDLKELQESDDVLRDGAERTESLSKALQAVEAIETTLNDLPDPDEAYIALSGLEAGVMDVEREKEAIQIFRDAIGKVELSESRMGPLENAPEALKECNKLWADIDRLDKLKDQTYAIKLACNDAVRSEKEILRLYHIEQEAKKKLDDAMGDVCPLCGKGVDTGEEE